MTAIWTSRLATVFLLGLKCSVRGALIISHPPNNSLVTNPVAVAIHIDLSQEVAYDPSLVHKLAVCWRLTEYSQELDDIEGGGAVENIIKSGCSPLQSAQIPSLDFLGVCKQCTSVGTQNSLARHSLEVSLEDNGSSGGARVVVKDVVNFALWQVEVSRSPPTSKADGGNNGVEGYELVVQAGPTSAKAKNGSNNNDVSEEEEEKRHPKKNTAATTTISTSSSRDNRGGHFSWAHRASIFALDESFDEYLDKARSLVRSLPWGLRAWCLFDGGEIGGSSDGGNVDDELTGLRSKRFCRNNSQTSSSETQSQSQQYEQRLGLQLERFDAVELPFVRSGSVGGLKYCRVSATISSEQCVMFAILETFLAAVSLNPICIASAAAATNDNDDTYVNLDATCSRRASIPNNASDASASRQHGEERLAKVLVLGSSSSWVFCDARGSVTSVALPGLVGRSAGAAARGQACSGEAATTPPAAEANSSSSSSGSNSFTDNVKDSGHLWCTGYVPGAAQKQESDSAEGRSGVSSPSTMGGLGGVDVRSVPGASALGILNEASQSGARRAFLERLPPLPPSPSSPASPVQSAPFNFSPPSSSSPATEIPAASPSYDVVAVLVGEVDRSVTMWKRAARHKSGVKAQLELAVKRLFEFLDNDVAPRLKPPPTQTQVRRRMQPCQRGEAAANTTSTATAGEHHIDDDVCTQPSTSLRFRSPRILLLGAPLPPVTRLEMLRQSYPHLVKEDEEAFHQGVFEETVLTLRFNERLREECAERSARWLRRHDRRSRDDGDDEGDVGGDINSKRENFDGGKIGWVCDYTEITEDTLELNTGRLSVFFANPEKADVHLHLERSLFFWRRALLKANGLHWCKNIKQE